MISTGMSKVDRILGGGLTPGGKYLLGSARGEGKTTLAMQLAYGAASPEFRVLIASGEESTQDLERTRLRMCRSNANVAVRGYAVDLGHILYDAEKEHIDLLVVDSLQTCSIEYVKGEIGSPSQIKAAVQELTSWSTRTRAAILVLCHFNRDGWFQAPKPSLDEFDCVLTLARTNNTSTMKILTADENKFGSTDDAAAIRITEQGFVEG